MFFTFDITLVLNVEGNRVTGTLHDTNAGPWSVEGTVNGNTLTGTYSSSPAGRFTLVLVNDRMARYTALTGDSRTITSDMRR
jgi:hypothetical protein